MYHEFTNFEMIEKAMTVLRPRKLSDDNSAGDVACALLSSSGDLFLGVCIDVGSGMGFCAEHSAIAAMVTAGRNQYLENRRSLGWRRCPSPLRAMQRIHVPN
jgi:hypothetical protein